MKFNIKFIALVFFLIVLMLDTSFVSSSRKFRTSHPNSTNDIVKSNQVKRKFTDAVKNLMKNYSFKECKGCINDIVFKENSNEFFPCQDNSAEKCYSCFGAGGIETESCKKGCVTKYKDDKLSQCFIHKDFNILAIQYNKLKKSFLANAVVNKPGNNDNPNLTLTSNDQNEHSPRYLPKPEEKPNEIFVEKFEEDEILYFIIDSSGSMYTDANLCRSSLSFEEYHKYPFIKRIDKVKEALKEKIHGLKPKQKYFIWESANKKAFDNLKGTKDTKAADNYIDKIDTVGIFLYEKVFEILEKKITKKENVHVTILTDGGFVESNVAKLPIIKNFVNKQFVKKWNLILYNKGGCDTEEEKKNDEKEMIELRQVVNFSDKMKKY